MSLFLLNRHGGYLRTAEDLISRHDLELPAKTEGAITEALAKRIMFTRYPEDRKAKSLEGIFKKARWSANTPNPLTDYRKFIGHYKILLQRDYKISAELTATSVHASSNSFAFGPRIKRAVNHCEALLRYSKKPPSRKDSLPIRQQKLFDALSDFTFGLLLAVSQPPTDVHQMLHAISEKNLQTIDLERLLLTLNQNQPGAHTGRPKDEYARVLSSAVYVWCQASRKPKYSNCGGSLSGPYIVYIKDVIKTADLPPLSDEALHSRLRIIAKRHHF